MVALCHEKLTVALKLYQVIASRTSGEDTHKLFNRVACFRQPYDSLFRLNRGDLVSDETSSKEKEAAAQMAADAVGGVGGPPQGFLHAQQQERDHPQEDVKHLDQAHESSFRTNLITENHGKYAERDPPATSEADFHTRAFWAGEVHKI